MDLRNCIEEVELRHFHLFCGLGGGARGFNRGRAIVGNMRAKFRCIGGIDSDPAAVRDFGKLAGVHGTRLDLFDREQYIAFHGKEPPSDWREAGPDDLRRAAGYERPHVVFLSAPCKGFSGLLSEVKSKSEKYQALNRLTLRGIFLTMEAWADNPPELLIFENVPRIASRGRVLLDRITSLLRHYGYAVAETAHDCGEIGGLAQSRKRFLLVARHVAKVPAFLYEPPRRPLRAVGEILGRMPLPGDPLAGPMHNVPRLKWKTWVRLAFVEAGSDWRSLNRLRVVDGKLADYLLVPASRHGDYLGVTRWDEHAGTVTGGANPTRGNFSIADPNFIKALRGGAFGVNSWDAPCGTVQGEPYPTNGSFCIADPKFNGSGYGEFGVVRMDEHIGAVTSQRSPGQGYFSVADLRYNPHFKNVYRIVKWDESSPTVAAGHGPSSGGLSVAAPMRQGPPTFSNEGRVLPWHSPAHAITGSHGTGQCIADVRPPNRELFGKYPVAKWNGPSGTVIGGDDTGAYAVADPRCINRDKGDAYLTGGHYGVTPWDQPSYSVSGAACHDNGPWSVADPRIPEAEENLVCVIRSMDDTWHRPFTTLELAALQSLVDPDEMFGGFESGAEPFNLDGASDGTKRERIGNAVPPQAAQAIADLMGETILRSMAGESFKLSALPIWVQPVAIALSVRTPMGELA